MKTRIKHCWYCKSRKIQSNADGTFKCLNCKRTLGNGQKKLSGEGYITLFMAFFLIIFVYSQWLNLVNAFLGKNYMIYLLGMVIFSLFFTKILVNIHKKNME